MYKLKYYLTNLWVFIFEIHYLYLKLNLAEDSLHSFNFLLIFYGLHDNVCKKTLQICKTAKYSVTYIVTD